MSRASRSRGFSPALLPSHSQFCPGCVWNTGSSCCYSWAPTFPEELQVGLMPLHGRSEMGVVDPSNRWGGAE